MEEYTYCNGDKIESVCWMDNEADCFCIKIRRWDNDKKHGFIIRVPIEEVIGAPLVREGYLYPHVRLQ